MCRKMRVDVVLPQVLAGRYVRPFVVEHATLLLAESCSTKQWPNLKLTIILSPGDIEIRSFVNFLPGAEP